MARPASAITCSTRARLPGWCTVSTMMISGIFMPGGPSFSAPYYRGCRPRAGPAIMRAPRREPFLLGEESAVAKAAALEPLDLFDVRAALSEEERLVQDAVARLVDAEVLPIIQRCFEEHRFPRGLIPQLASLGLLGSSIHGYECAGQRHQLWPHLPGARARRLGHPQLRVRAVLAVHVPDLRLRLRGAEAALPA